MVPRLEREPFVVYSGGMVEVGWVKSLAPIVLRCSDWFRSEFFSVPDSELVAAQAEAQNTKSNAIDAKWVRRSLIFSFPFRPPALVARTSLRLRAARHHQSSGCCTGGSSPRAR